jgi:hypothetical protein
MKLESRLAAYIHHSKTRPCRQKSKTGRASQIVRLIATARRVQPVVAEVVAMKYIFAWMLGVPGFLIVIWFLINHH